MRIKLKHYLPLFWSRLAFGAALLLILTALSLPQVNKPQAATDQVILDITRKGTGMIFPTVRQIYFRLYESGRLEYEVPPAYDRPSWHLEKREARVSVKDIEALSQLAEQPTFINAAKEYPGLEQEIDAVMVTTVTYRRGDHKKQIVIVNYRPENPRAESYYPASLRLLLQKVVQIRPKTDDEIMYGGGTIY